MSTDTFSTRAISRACAKANQLMSDHQDRFADRRGRSDQPVAALASHALETLVRRKGKLRPLLSEKLIDQLVAASHSLGTEGVDGAITDILHTGVPREEILDFYIPEAARRLGDGWCDDRFSFADVTIGASRLQRAVRALSELTIGGSRRLTRRSALVFALEGQSHTLGPTLFTEQLRRQGVSVRLMLSAPNHSVVETVADGSFDAIFLSVSVDDTLARARSLVDKIRTVAKAPVPIMVGGAVCAMGLDVRELTGADHSGTDAREALRLCGLTNSHQDAGVPASGGI